MEYTKEQLEKILNDLMQHNNSDVRAAVAEQGYGLDVLVNDSNLGVRNVAKETFAKQKSPAFVSVPLNELLNYISLFGEIKFGEVNDSEFLIRRAVMYLHHYGIKTVNSLRDASNEELSNISRSRARIFVHMRDVVKEHFDTIAQNYVEWKNSTITAVVFRNEITNHQIDVFLDVFPKNYSHQKYDFLLTAEEEAQAYKKLKEFAGAHGLSVSGYVIVGTEIVPKEQVEKTAPGALIAGGVSFTSAGVVEDLLADATARSEETSDNAKEPERVLD